MQNARVALAALMMLTAAASSVSAQQPPQAPAPRAQTNAPAPQQQQDPVAVAAALNMSRSRLYQQRDTAGVASLYTAEATYVELMPILQVLRGREQIKGHFEELIGASAMDIVPNVRDASRNADGTIFVSGDYVVVSRTSGAGPGDTSEVSGHFTQTLRREEDGEWRIAAHVFARPTPVTSRERDMYDRD